MAKSAQMKRASHLFTQLLSRQDGDGGSDLWEVNVKPSGKHMVLPMITLRKKGPS